LQQLPSSIGPATPVLLRGDRWFIVERVAHADCEVLKAVGAGDNLGVMRRFLLPFERLRVLERHAAPRVVTRRRFMRSLAGSLALCCAAGELRAAAGARIALLPWQLEPALAIVRGHATRVLLADEVGLGKTVQAGLVLAELSARGLGDRVLIVTPAGLRDQWIDELRERFGIDAELADARFLRRAAASLRAGANPWALARPLVVSIDFLKQPEVLSGVTSVLWDAVVIDEAHGASGPSDRHAAASGVGRRARVVLLLTATPHAGDEAAFDSLCGLAAFDTERERLLIFRRTRADVGQAVSRRTRVLHVRLSDAERHMHDVLQRYARRVWTEARERGNRDAQLAMAVLQKRALSSPSSLASSAARRLQWLAAREADPGDQLALPLFDAGETDEADAEPDAVLAAPGLADRRKEQAWLAAVAEAARAAAFTERKLAALLRLLRRTQEPAIVFTEYRDTLARLTTAIERICRCTCLHGGLGRQQRADALQRFARGEARVLLATDAAGEGLNLQARCRWVINYELPWSPVRLEQRAGRVDRIGQTRTVHTVLLVARNSAERAVVSRLAARIDRIRSAAAGTFLGSAADLAIADALIHGDPGLESAKPELSSTPAAPLGGRMQVHLSDSTLAHSAVREIARLTALRHLRRPWPSADERPSILRLSPSRLNRLGRRLPAPGLITLERILVADRCGREIDRRVVALSLRTAAAVPRGSAALRRSVERLLADTSQARSAALAAALDEAQVATTAHLAMLGALLKREQAILRDLQNLATGPIQPGLFDRRALREAAAARHHADSLRALSEMRIRRLEAGLETQTKTTTELVIVITNRDGTQDSGMRNEA
jgi:ERCC4-related helicase